MKIFNTSNNNSSNNSSTSVHLLSNGCGATNATSTRAHEYHQKNLSTGNVSPAATTPTSTPQVQVKLEPRVPSPCTADLALIANGTGAKGLKTSVPPSASAKDLSVYLTTPTKSLTVNTSSTTPPLIRQQPQQPVFANAGANCISKQSNDSLDLFSSSSSISSISSTNSLSGLTASCKIVGSSTSSSPPLLIKNHSPTTATQQFLSTSPGTPNSTMNGMIGGIKRQHDEAFGLDQCSSTPSPPMMTTINGHSLHPLLPQTTTPINGCSNASMTGSPTSSYSDFGSACK